MRPGFGAEMSSAFGRPVDLFRLGEIFHRKHLAVAFRHADAYRIHVAIQDVGAMLRRPHEALVNRCRVLSLVHVLGNPAEVGAGRFRAGEQIGLAQKLVRDRSLLCHALRMGTGSVGEGFVWLQGRQSMRLPFLVGGIEQLALRV